MPTITDVDFEYEAGEHSTVIRTSGNPGHIILNQYWVNIRYSNGTSSRINLKNDFRSIIGRKRITPERRTQIEALIQSQKQMLVGITVDTQDREYNYSKTTYWQNVSRYSYEKRTYTGLDENSLITITDLLNEGLRSIFT